MNPIANLGRPIQQVVLCASAILGDMLAELAKTDGGIEWQVLVCKDANPDLGQVTASRARVLICDRSRCAACPRNCLRALAESCPDARVLALGGDPKTADLPQAAPPLVWYLPSPFTADELRWARLHLAVCAGAEEATEGLARIALRDDSLRKRLSHKWPEADSQTIAQAIEEALVNYLGDPRQLNQTEGQTLPGFLRMVARRRLSDLMRAGGSLDAPRHSQGRAEPPADVDAKIWLESLLPATDDVVSEVCAEDARLELMRLLQPSDQAILQLRLQELTSRQIAESTGLSQSAVERALERIRAAASRLRLGG